MFVNAISLFQCCTDEPQRLLCFLFVRNLYFHHVLALFFSLSLSFRSFTRYAKCMSFLIIAAWNSASPLHLQTQVFFHHRQIIFYYLIIVFLPSVPFYLYGMPIIFISFLDLFYSLFIVLQCFDHLKFLSLFFQG
jgi:hypothetical protein